MRVLYFTSAYRPDSMASHTHGDLVAALRQRGAAVDILTIGAAITALLGLPRPMGSGERGRAMTVQMPSLTSTIG